MRICREHERDYLTLLMDRFYILMDEVIDFTNEIETNAIHILRERFDRLSELGYQEHTEARRARFVREFCMIDSRLQSLIWYFSLCPPGSPKAPSVTVQRRRQPQ